MAEGTEALQTRIWTNLKVAIQFTLCSHSPRNNSAGARFSQALIVSQQTCCGSHVFFKVTYGQFITCFFFFLIDR